MDTYIDMKAGLSSVFTCISLFIVWHIHITVFTLSNWERRMPYFAQITLFDLFSLYLLGMLFTLLEILEMLFTDKLMRKLHTFTAISY